MIESILKQCFEGVGVIVFTKQRFLGINTEFGSLNYNNFDENIFTSSISFLDYDVVVISTNFISSRYPESSTSPYQNKRLLSNYASNQITEDYKIIKEQLIELLIVNGFCDTPLLERIEDVFPNQMLKYCEARNHVLVTTTQLLCLYIETRNDLSCLDERINGLLSTVGIYQPYQNITDFIKPIT